MASMTLLRRISISVVAVTIILLGAFWIAPVGLSFYEAKKAPHIARVVPNSLKDLSISQAPGEGLSYFGYAFEVPWTDLDETQTKLTPKENPCKAILSFRSGLRMAVTSIPSGNWARSLSQEMKVPSERFESAFGKSDYDFLKNLYEFTPDKMHHWTTSQRSREQLLLIIKSIALTQSAETGIFNIQNQSFRGFQEGNPGVKQALILVHLLSDEGSIEFVFVQKDYQRPGGLTPPEINRIIQSLRRLPQSGTRFPKGQR